MEDVSLPDEQQNKLDSVVDQLNKMWHKRNEVKVEPTPDGNHDSFLSQFDHLNTKINPLITNINKKLGSGLTLHLFSDKGMESSRKFFQVVLSDDPAHVDILHAPYLLIEGYPNSGKVRIIQSTENEEVAGKELDVANVNDALLAESMTSFLSTTVPIKK